MYGYGYSPGMMFTKVGIMLLGLIIFAVGALPILKTFMPEQLAFLPSNPLIYQILTAFFGLAVVAYAIKHVQVY